jgi:hypothetical protein
MRKVLRKILEILDGTPAVYGKQKSRSGQSVVELSLVTPILIVLLMGLAEIGWFANNFLILLEVTRVGARYGTTQTGETSPLSWNNDASRATGTGFGDYPPTIGGRPVTDYRNCLEIRNPNNTELQGFYNSIACVMTQQMDPLSLVFDNGVDDLVISAFSLQAIDPSSLPSGNFYRYDGSIATQPPRNQINPSLDPALGNNTQMIVVGRYPTNANECTVDANGDPMVWERDPFDYFQDSTRNFQLINVAEPDSEENRNYVELEGYDGASYPPYVAVAPAPQPAPMRERQRGWVLYNQHGISNTVDPTAGVNSKQCYGSEWTIQEVQDLFNVTNFIIGIDPDKREQESARLPSQGMVMVEMFWQHELLLKNPVFNPVWTILGDNTTVSVWAAFPLPATEPRIKFND